MARLLERERELAAVEQLLGTGGAVLVVEGGAGIGKTALLDAACDRAAASRHEVVRARGSRLEAGFGYGVVRQLFERRVAQADEHGRDALLAGAARAVRPLLLGEALETAATDTSFAVLHGLYWLTVNLAERRPVLIAVDDAHWAERRRCAGWPTWRPGCRRRPSRWWSRSGRVSPPRRERPSRCCARRPGPSCAPDR